MNVIVAAIAQGILWGLLSLGVFISFRVLNIADMTTEGSFPLGAVVCTMLLHYGFHPIIATAIAFFVGMGAGLVTGFLITVWRIPSLLAGILVMTAMLSINLRILGRPNLNLTGKATIFTLVSNVGLPRHFDTILVGTILIVAAIGLLYVFFSTELGQALIATGDNDKMAVSLGIATNRMIMLGLMIANGLVALAGAVMAQAQSYADVNSGIGTIVIALAAIIIGEVVFGDLSFLSRLICIIFGSIIYRILLAFVLSLEMIQPDDFKFISAALIAICLSVPHIRISVARWFSVKKGGAA